MHRAMAEMQRLVDKYPAGFEDGASSDSSEVENKALSKELESLKLKGPEGVDGQSGDKA